MLMPRAWGMVIPLWYVAGMHVKTVEAVARRTAERREEALGARASRRA